MVKLLWFSSPHFVYFEKKYCFENRTLEHLNWFVIFWIKLCYANGKVQSLNQRKGWNWRKIIQLARGMTFQSFYNNLGLSHAVIVHEYTGFIYWVLEANQLSKTILWKLKATRINWLWPEIFLGRSSGNLVCIRTLHSGIHYMNSTEQVKLNQTWNWSRFLKPLTIYIFMFSNCKNFQQKNGFAINGIILCFEIHLLSMQTKMIVLVSENNELFTMTVASWWS